MLKKMIGIGIVFIMVVFNSYGKEENFKEISKKKYGTDTLHTYEHIQSGAKIIWIENTDERKSFTLGVKTPTKDSTGVNHIIEHTVFTGSKKYPSASLFFDASEAYPSLYINALTSGDMTIYPFATPYISCYNQLLDIYLDSIFHPSMLSQPSGFYEESFNYNSSTGGYGGVVYNEMKGAYSNTERRIYRAIRGALYQNTPYAEDSGGDPNEIPKLRYEDFIKTYKDYYYPANMQIILYGKLPIGEVLDTLQTYLKDYSKSKEAINLNVVLPQVLENQTIKALPIGEKTCLAKTLRIEKSLTAIQLEELGLWIDAYILNPHSTFQTRLQEEGLNPIKMFKDEDLPYPLYTFIIQDIEEDKKEMSQRSLEKIFQELIECTTPNEVIEKDTLKRARLGLYIQDQNANRGIQISHEILDGWAHERETDQYYLRKEKITKLRCLDIDKIKGLLQETSWVTLELCSGEEQVKSPMDLSLISHEKWNQIIENMSHWQNESNYKPLQVLDIEDFILKPTLTPEIKGEEDRAYVTTNISKGLARTQLYYNTSHMPQEKLPYMFLYTYLLNESAKEQVPFRGILEGKCTAFQDAKGYSTFLKLTVLSDAHEKHHGDIFLSARKRLLTQNDAWYRRKMVQFKTDFRENWEENNLEALISLSKGCSTGVKRYFYEMGYPLYTFCKQLENQQEQMWINEIKKIDDNIYNQKGVVMATTAHIPYYNPYQKNWEKVIKSQPKKEIQVADYTFTTFPERSILLNASEVDYIYNEYMVEDRCLDGVDFLTMAYITKHYLTPLIRTKSGAYGSGGQAHFPDTLTLYTYRDPNYKRSLDVFESIPQFLEGGITTERLALSKLEALSHVHNQFKLLSGDMEQADALESSIMLGVSPDNIIALQNQIIAAQAKDIQDKGDLFKNMISKGRMGIATRHYPESLLQGYKVYSF